MEKQNKETSKISDKAFSRFLVTSVIGILVSIACLCSTTFAWFSASVESEKNEISMTNASQLTVSVVKSDESEPIATANVHSPVTLTDIQGEYTVTLTLPRESASGYLILTVDGADYYTNFLKRNAAEEQKLSFTLILTSAKDVTFTVRWGIYSGDADINNEGTLNIS